MFTIGTCCCRFESMELVYDIISDYTRFFQHKHGGGKIEQLAT